MSPVQRYYHPEAGFNCRMTNLQAALGCAQLERIEELQAKRSSILEHYREMFSEGQGLSLNPKMSWAEPVNWMVCAVLSEELAPRRDRLLAELKNTGIDTRPFFVPVKDMPPYNNCRVVGAEGDEAPVTVRLSETGFNLPSSPGLEDRSVTMIASALRDLLEEP